MSTFRIDEANIQRGQWPRGSSLYSGIDEINIKRQWWPGGSSSSSTTIKKKYSDDDDKPFSLLSTPYGENIRKRWQAPGSSSSFATSRQKTLEVDDELGARCCLLQLLEKKSYDDKLGGLLLSFDLLLWCFKP